MAQGIRASFLFLLYLHQQQQQQHTITTISSPTIAPNTAPTIVPVSSSLFDLLSPVE